MNSHQFSLVLLNIIAASSCFGLETIKFSRMLFLSYMSNQASSVRSIYLPPLKYRNFSIFMIEVCKKKSFAIVLRRKVTPLFIGSALVSALITKCTYYYQTLQVKCTSSCTLSALTVTFRLSLTVLISHCYRAGLSRPHYISHLVHSDQM